MLYKNINGKRGLQLPLFLLILFVNVTSGFAQVNDSTNQAPQLEQGPPGNPNRTNAPVRRAPAAPVLTPTPEPTRPERQEPAVRSTPEPERVNDNAPKVRPTFKEKLFVAGSATLGFTSSSYLGTLFRIGASPMLGYRITKRFAFGPGITYQYNVAGHVSYSDYGAKAFAQAIVYGPILLHAEHAFLSTQAYLVNQNGQIVDKTRRGLQETLAGIGYRQMASDRFGYDLYLLFRVNTTDEYNTRNSVPIFRAGFIYNLK